jgi:hypothetical protein
MEKEVVLASIIGPVYLVYGLSVLIYAKQWKKLVAWLEKDHFAFFPLAMILLIFGMILVNAYNIWDWNVFMIISLTGWVILFKAVFYFLAPGSWITAVLRWTVLRHDGFYRFAGAFIAILGASLMYCGYFQR